MASGVIDIHPHIISTDTERYPRIPLFGIQSDWSRERPVTLEGLIAAMDEAGVGKAAIVQSSTCYGYDNSYVAEAIAKHPDRFTAVGSVDVCKPDACDRIRHWVGRGVTGLRLFTGGSTAAFDPSSLDDPQSFTAWGLCGELGLSMCIQTDASGLAQVAGLAKRFPKVRIVLDHLGRPDVSDGPPYRKASSLFGLAPFENIFLKLTPRIMADAQRGQASADTFFPRLVSVFGSDRLAWGSNFPASEGKLAENLAKARMGLASLSAEDQTWVLGKTARRLYPALAK
ncbi:MAG TPA: amidohydrolase family protein [Steroidobacteraceae bacterium]|jgi:predicted TIM-barrel fold metal-dependent hydrolase|nr:amidohydrolase family protein [Steroidobacteraceae bacterium]